ncbi:MAG: hypothetical protein IJU35_06345 [Paludibacteraceae bacterium]|nr:hypothetical protein [Paludibacteraceae bacterium]
MKRVNNLYVPHTAQGVLMEEKPAACGSACGSGDKPVACGSACGAGDPQPKPAACGSACGAGDK